MKWIRALEALPAQMQHVPSLNDHLKQLTRKAQDVIALPSALEPLFPLLAVIPLQLLAYHVAVARGCDVDNLPHS